MPGALGVAEGAGLGQLGAAEAAQHLGKHLVGGAAERLGEPPAALRGSRVGSGGREDSEECGGGGREQQAAGSTHLTSLTHVCL